VNASARLLAIANDVASFEPGPLSLEAHVQFPAVTRTRAGRNAAVLVIAFAIGPYIVSVYFSANIAEKYTDHASRTRQK
jgi:hypothetical protein